MSDVEMLHIITAPTRYRIVLLLLEHNYCIKALAAKLGISEPAVSQQMRLLKEYGVVTSKKIEHHTHYVINHDLMLNALKAIEKSVSALIDTQSDPENCDCELIVSCNRR